MSKKTITTAQKITKSDLAKLTADECNISNKQCELIIDIFLDKIVKSIKDNSEVFITGFGTFAKKIRKARNGVNPRTGAKLFIPETEKVKFAPGKLLK